MIEAAAVEHLAVFESYQTKVKGEVREPDLVAVVFLDRLDHAAQLVVRTRALIVALDHRANYA